MKITLPTFLQVDPLAKLIAQKMRDDPAGWDITMETWTYKNRIKLNPHSMEVEWPAPRRFNYVSRLYLRAACSDLVLHHEKEKRKRERELYERNNAMVWSALLSDAPPPKDMTPAQMYMMQNTDPMVRYYEDLEREQSSFMQQYLRKTDRYHQDSTDRGTI